MWTPAGPSRNCVDPLDPGRTAGGAMPATGAGWTTRVTGLAMATAKPNKAKGSWTHSRSGPIVNTPRRLVGNTTVDEALVSEPIRSHRIRRPTSVANATRGRAGLVEGRSVEAPALPVVRRSVETQRREVGTARVRQLHQEAAGSTDGYQRRSDHHVDLGAGRTMRHGRGPRRGRSPREGRQPPARAGGSNLPC